MASKSISLNKFRGLTAYRTEATPLIFAHYTEISRCTVADNYN